METNDVLDIYDKLDNVGVELSTESREIYSVLTALNDALDEDLPDALQKLADDGLSHCVHAYAKNERLALRRILHDDTNIQNRYTRFLINSLRDDVQIAKKQISEQLSKLEEQ